VVPPSGELKIEVYTASLTYPVVAAYSAADCNNLSPIPGGCASGTDPVTVLFLDSEVSAGETVYLRVYGEQAKSGSFGIAAVDPTAEIVGFTGPGGVGDSISNKLWLRADQGVLTPSGLPAGQGENVETWLDQSGSSNNLVQNSGSNQPTFESSSLNGFPGLDFDGSSSFFTRDLSTSFTASAPLRFYAVSRFTASTEQTLISLGDENNTNTLSISKEADNTYYSYSQGSKRAGPALNTSGQIISSFYDNSGVYHRLFLNGTEQSADNLSSPVFTNGVLNTGRSREGDLYYEGELSELIIYRKKLNEAQRIIVNNYLSSKYNL
jgi:hypothetical protein